MGATRTLFVPIRIDGLYIKSEGLTFGSPLAADFSLLPYQLNDDTYQRGLNLAESLFAKEGSLLFPKGLHLHWALPDALTTGHHRDNRTVFPAVPNRWLVRRLDSTGKLQKSMIVESDFLHPCEDNGQPTYQKPSNGIADWTPITFPTERQFANGPAFRYMGRTLSLDDWFKAPPGNDYLNQHDQNLNYKFSQYPLTALGYGEPTFAAYYPNCYSVFGFCDVDSALDEGTSYQYQVIGWFNEVDLDPLQSSEFAQLKNDADRFNALDQEYRWCLDKALTSQPFPARVVCYGSLTLTPKTATPWKAPDKSTLRIAIGNTGGEALAALLADDVAQQSTNKVIIEDQLEAMNVAAALQGIEVDYAAHFAQTRHQRGFRGISGGSHWAVLPKMTKPQPLLPSGANEDDLQHPSLPDAAAHALNALNIAQETYEMAQQEIVELRYQTFCDWHKFMVAYYSSSGFDVYQSQKLQLGKFINNQTIKLLNSKIAQAGKLVLTKDTATADGAYKATLDLAKNTLSPLQPVNQTLAVQVILRLKALIDVLIEAKITDQFEITNRASEHFWRPREPVVLLSSPVAVSTARHGEDGDLPCTVLDVADAPGTRAFIDSIDKWKLTVSDRFVQNQSGSPWHPIILNWGVSLFPLATGRKQNNDINKTYDYDPAFITGTFGLQENKPDLSQPDKLSLLPAQSYVGRCVMTPTASTQLDSNLRNFLLKTTLDDCRDLAASKDAGYIDRLIAWYAVKHKVATPIAEAEKAHWLKLQRPFVDPTNKDEDGNPCLLPVKDLYNWYGDKPVNGTNNTFGKWTDTQKAQDPIYSALSALNRLDGMTVLSQALGGFNAALMTREQVLQIPIEDPLNDKIIPTHLRELDLTNNVAKAVGGHHPTGPLPFMVFNPIRSGTLTLESLSLIDTFGQQWNAPLGGERLVTSNSLSYPKQKDQTTTITYLPPRIASATRLNFRWLAALSNQNGIDEVEMNSSPATTPICGWLLPNNFDNSVMVYDHTGEALGSINMLAEWSPAPGSSNQLAASEIPNPHLRRLIRRLVVDVGTAAADVPIRQHFLETFLSTLDSAIEAIEPASFAQHEALALLMGRPLAVVRARVDLQLMGQPTIQETVDDPTILGGKAIRLKKSSLWKAFADQDWGVFAYDWGQFYGCSYADVMVNQSCAFSPLDERKNDDYARTTHGFEKTAIPVRLGEHQLLNDGLVGFWKETAEGELDNVFHAPLDGKADNLTLTLSDDPLTLTMIMDPRGVIHATSGVLPVNQLEIAPAYFADALKRMGVTFRVSPLLTDAEQLHAALPKEPGYVWSWVTRTNASTWEETGAIADATEHAHFFKPPKIVEGWLKLAPKNKA